jgi:hypothetical protein
MTLSILAATTLVSSCHRWLRPSASRPARVRSAASFSAETVNGTNSFNHEVSISMTRNFHVAMKKNESVTVTKNASPYPGEDIY